MDDSSVQQLIWAALAMALPLAAIFGHWPRLAGRFGEGDRVMQLWHVGPVVWGACQLLDGHERYLGWALAGRLHLRRYDFGPGHLLGYGFTQQQLHAVFVLRRDVAGDLSGHFYGRRFGLRDGRMVPVQILEPHSRHWRRLA
jgi:hypothetical protein